MDNRDAFWIGVGVCLFVIVVVAAVLNAPGGDIAAPATGRVVDKIEVATGYNHTLHIIKLEVAADRFSYIATSARVWHAAVVDAVYTFEGPAGGKSYDIITEEKRE